MKEKTCVICNSRFRGNTCAKFCSEACRHENELRRDRIRKHTGKRKPAKPYSRERNAELKREQRRKRARLRAQAEAFIPMGPPARTTRNCVVCSEPFPIHGPTLTCCAECSRIRHLQKKEQRRQVWRTTREGPRP